MLRSVVWWVKKTSRQHSLITVTDRVRVDVARALTLLARYAILRVSEIAVRAFVAAEIHHLYWCAEQITLTIQEGQSSLTVDQCNQVDILCTEHLHRCAECMGRPRGRGTSVIKIRKWDIAQKCNTACICHWFVNVSTTVLIFHFIFIFGTTTLEPLRRISRAM